MKMQKSARTIITLALAAAAATAPAAAHESRLIPASTGFIRLSVGFAAEPAWEDSYNGVDVILNSYDSACTETPRGYFGAPIDPAGTTSNATPDKVDLEVTVGYLKASVPPTGPNGTIRPGGILKWLVLTDKSPLAAKFNTPGTFNTYFRPTHPGVYGFRVRGTVSTGPKVSKNCPGHTAPVQLAARSATFDVYFVCGEAGSFSPPSHFNCVEAQQTFPGGPFAPYAPDQAP
jgi:hypothetical protein